MGLGRRGLASARAFAQSRAGAGGATGDARRAPAIELERRSQLFLAEPKRCSLADPRLKARIVELPGGAGLAALLEAEAPAFFVALEAEGLPGRFEDSGFHLGPGERRLVRFLPAAAGSEARDAAPGAALRNGAAAGTQAGAGAQAAAAPQAAKLAAALRVMHLRSSFD